MEVEIRRHQIALGIPFIYVTHNQEEALSMSDRIAVVRKGRIEDFAPRTEIYDRPKTAFIAQFVGRSNRFEGTTEEGGRLTTMCGVAIELPSSISVGKPVALFVKNEKLRLTSPGETPLEGPNRIACTVKDVILRGAYADYILACGSRELHASRPRSERAFAAGEAVVGSFDPADIDAFDESAEDQS
jgi:putative spermidine/putrescine transport system ATP-binding protein/spermidine/putrescine transport system ATP-binding protein